MKTVVVGASPKPHRYSYKAIKSLQVNHHETVALGIRSGRVDEQEILDIKLKPEIENVDTVTLYVSPERLKGYEGYLLSLKPKRIIFNPGAENKEFEKQAQDLGIEVNNACTLVMLNMGAY